MENNYKQIIIAVVLLIAGLAVGRMCMTPKSDNAQTDLLQARIDSIEVEFSAIETDNESHVELLASAPQNAWWDALESVFGYRPIGAEAALWGRLVKHIQEAGDSPDEIPRRAALWLVGPVWEGRQTPPRLTPGALLKHWQWLGSKVASASEAELASWRDEYKKLERAKNIEGAS